MSDELSQQWGGDIVYNHDNYAATRGELDEQLAVLVESFLPPDKSGRCSDGFVSDVLLRCLDYIVATDEAKAKLKQMMDNWDSEEDDDFEDDEDE